MAILRHGLPVSVVRLGEQLELRWTFANGTRNDHLDIFVDKCQAERIGGEPPEPKPLLLLSDGCPAPRAFAAHLIGKKVQPRKDGKSFNTSLRVFRFEGSRRVRIRCSVSICVEKCEPVYCSEGEERVVGPGTRGRRRRDKQNSAAMATLGELAQLIEGNERIRNEAKESRTNIHPQKSATISGSYTITDELPKEEKKAEEDEEEKRWRNGGRIDGEGTKHGTEQREKTKIGILAPSNRVVVMGAKGRTEERQDKSNDEEEEKQKEADGRESKTKEGKSKTHKNIWRNEIGTTEEEKERKEVDAMSSSWPSPPPSSSPLVLCISRPAALLAVLSLVILAIIQFVHFGTFLQKKYAKKGTNISSRNEPIVEEKHPMPPNSSEDSSSNSENGFRNGSGPIWHKTSAICAQEMQYNRNWHYDNAKGIQFERERSAANVNWWANANSEDEEGQQKRKGQKQKQTVFPAEPIPPKGMRKTEEYV